MPESQDLGGTQEAPAKKKGGRKAGMTEKQRRFAQEYVLDMNATQAAKRAGFSEKTSEEIGRQLLQKTWVKAEIDRLMALKSKELDLSLTAILDELKLYAFARLPNSYAVDFTSDRIGALKELGKHFGLGKEPDGEGSNSRSQLVDVGTIRDIVGLIRK